MSLALPSFKPVLWEYFAFNYYYINLLFHHFSHLTLPYVAYTLCSTCVEALQLSFIFIYFLVFTLLCLISFGSFWTKNKSFSSVILDFLAFFPFLHFVLFLKSFVYAMDDVWSAKLKPPYLLFVTRASPSRVLYKFTCFEFCDGNHLEFSCQNFSLNCGSGCPIIFIGDF